MERELLTLLAEMESSQIWHPVETIRIAMIRKMIRLACKASRLGPQLEQELRENERKYDRDKHAQEVTKVR